MLSVFEFCSVPSCDKHSWTKWQELQVLCPEVWTSLFSLSLVQELHREHNRCGFATKDF